MDTTDVVLRMPTMKAVRLPPTPDSVDVFVSDEFYTNYVEAYAEIADWCGSNICEGVDSRDIYYYYLEKADGFFASDGWWIVKSSGGMFSAYTDEQYNEIFVKQYQ